MGIFTKFKQKKNQDGITVTPEKSMDVFIEFSDWLNQHLAKELPSNIAAINFNLYESPVKDYMIELVGCDSFDEQDSDWACDEVFDTRGAPYTINQRNNIINWEQGLSLAIELVERYLQEGMYADKLKSYTAIGVGFVDGDIALVHQRK